MSFVFWAADSLGKKCLSEIAMNASSTTSKVTHNICLIEHICHYQANEFCRMRPQLNRLRSLVISLRLSVVICCFTFSMFANAFGERRRKTEKKKRNAIARRDYGHFFMPLPSESERARERGRERERETATFVCRQYHCCVTILCYFALLGVLFRTTSPPAIRTHFSDIHANSTLSPRLCVCVLFVSPHSSRPNRKRKMRQKNDKNKNI